MIFRTGRILPGDMDNSSTPIARKRLVNVVSAPSSPQIPAQIPRNDPRCIAGIISVHGDLRGGDGHCGTYAPEKTAESGKKIKIFKNLLRISK